MLLSALAAIASVLCVLAGCKPTSVHVPAELVTPSSALVKDVFENVADSSGIGVFTHTDGSSGRKFFVEQMGGGVAILDYDNDGWQDVYLCSGGALPGYKGPPPQNRLFRNKRDGSFEDVTEKAGVACRKYCIGVAAGDFDNDGFLDLYVTGFQGNTLYRNNGNGTFTDVTKTARVAGGRLSSSAAWMDIDGDGYLDLFVCNYVKYTLAIDKFCNRFPGQKSYCGPNLYEPEHCILYHNDHNGTFTDISGKSGILKKDGNGLAVTWVDADEDGKPDIFVANDQSPNHLWRNNGDGTFSDQASEMGVAFGEQGNAQAGMGVDTGDYDNDGHLDLLLTTFSEEPRAIYRREGAGYRDVSFASGVGSATLMYLGFGTAFLDYDRDGWLDLFFANGHVLDDIGRYSDSVQWEQSNQLFRNKANGTFEETSQATGIGEGKRVSRGAAFGDLFNDGHTDIIVNVLRGKPLVLRNRCGATNHWLELDLRASWGNPQAQGAQVWLTAGGKTQRRDVRTCGSYASSSDVRPLFGLGTATTVDEVKVKWPDGKFTTIKGPAIVRIVRVDEPALPTH
jgi:hypothetical protein